MAWIFQISASHSGSRFYETNINTITLIIGLCSLLSKPDETPAESTSSDTEDFPEKEKTVSFSWGIVMVRTKKLLYLLDRLAKFRIFSGLGWAMIAITIIAAAFMVWLMVENTYILVTSSLQFRCLVGAAPASQCTASGYSPGQPLPLQSYLLLPGINPYIPIFYGLVGIIVAVVIHEGTHGVLARRFHLPVKSTGVIFFLFVPIGAFVEVDEKLIAKARFRDSGRIMAGGPGSNIIVAAICLLLLLTIVGGLVPHSYNGVYVGSIVSKSPADLLHTQGVLSSGDLIVAANGTQVKSEQALSNFMSTTKPNETLVISIQHQGQVNNYSIVLGQSPSNKSIGFIGVGDVMSQSDLISVKNTYVNAIFSTRSTVYLIVPGILPQAETVVPFSNTLHNLYTSPVLGDAWYPIALTLFWIFFININLAFFNAIPLYPLDGGQAFLNFLSHTGKPWIEKRAKSITTISSVIMLVLILGFLFLPRLLSLIPI
jgi:membrane-associated protease RseP (regulator of RpoE activity)